MTFYPVRYVQATRTLRFTGQQMRYLDVYVDPDKCNGKYRPTRKTKECSDCV